MLDQILNFIDYKNSTSNHLDGWLKALNHYDSSEVDSIDEEVWETAREYDSAPNFGNIVQEVVLRKLKAAIIDSEDDDNNKVLLNASISDYINGHDTHFFINNIRMYDLFEIQTAIKELYDEEEVLFNAEREFADGEILDDDE